MINKKVTITVLIMTFQLLSFFLSSAGAAGSYKITPVEFKIKEVRIQYPKVSGFTDKKRQTKINDLIKHEALSILYLYGTGFGIEPPDINFDTFSLEIRYDIAGQSNSLLSITYSGLGNRYLSAHPNKLFYTTNINLKTASKVRLSDAVIIDDAFVKMIKSGSFQPVYSLLGKNALLDLLSSSFSDHELKQMLLNADNLENIGNVYHSDFFSYFTKDMLCISIPLPDAVGGYAVIGLKYKDILPFIKEYNGIQNSFAFEMMN